MTEVEISSIFMEHIEVHNDLTCISADGSKSSVGVGFRFLVVSLALGIHFLILYIFLWPSWLKFLLFKKIASMDGVNFAVSDANCFTFTFCF